MTFSFETSIGNNGYTGAILIPDDIAAQLATDKIKRVVATVMANDKEIILYAGIAKKHGVIYMMFSKANQKTLGVKAGDSLKIDMREDTSKYQAPMPEELEAVLLSDYEAYEIFESLLPGKQRNIIFMVYRVIDSQKRVDIALNIMENLKIGNHNPIKFEKLL
ncbi:hypothetical protein JCM19297_3579 [Nonlabens ulvanivorans]|nr:YdeI/OmpD-associated family protein [Nonlabens ulvanivorans]GAK89055.1 hypothetical protein JCM19297_3579 [Nonlabens ulvanivorans]